MRNFNCLILQVTNVKLLRSFEDEFLRYAQWPSTRMSSWRLEGECFVGRIKPVLGKELGYALEYCQIMVIENAQ